MLELRPEPQVPLLLPEHLALGDSTGVAKVAALCGDCMVATGSLTCQSDGAGGTGISPLNTGR